MNAPSYDIQVDLEVLKALTSRLEEEGQTHNDVLRDLLRLDSPLDAEEVDTPLQRVAHSFGQGLAGGAFYSRGLVLPDGTELRARYKGREYRAVIKGSKFVTEDDVPHDSPSAAANHITATTVNGLRFWQGKLPGDKGWRRLDVIRDHRE